MKTFFSRLIAACLMALATSLAQSETCNPPPVGVAELREVSPGMYGVAGPLADFDPCNSSVDLNIPWGAEKPPLIIISHGGSGISLNEKNAAAAFRKLGFATLIYSTYEMNGLYRDWKFWATNVTLGARQRMNFKTTLGAYKWAIQNTKIDSSQIYFYGNSNGAATVVNIAAVVDPSHVKGVFPEGLTGAGLGLPNNLNVPVRLIYGLLDNYGGRSAEDWRWLIQEKCRANIPPNPSLYPKGNSQNCNFDVNPDQLTQKPIDWFYEQKKKGANIDIWWIDNAAHGMFQGPLSKATRTWGVSDLRYASEGADSDARELFLDRLKVFLASSKKN